MAFDWIDRVPMPARLVSLVESFLARETDHLTSDAHYSAVRAGGSAVGHGVADEA